MAEAYRSMNRTENPKILYLYVNTLQLIFKRVPRPFDRERILFSTIGARTTGHPHEKNEAGYLSHSI